MCKKGFTSIFATHIFNTRAERVNIRLRASDKVILRFWRHITIRAHITEMSFAILRLFSGIKVKERPSIQQLLIFSII